MTEQKCKSADTCLAHSDNCCVPHKHAPRCFVWPQPTMMICPTEHSTACGVKNCSSRSPHERADVCGLPCIVRIEKMVYCIPHGQAAPESEETEWADSYCLASVRRIASADSGVARVSPIVILAMCDEIERLRDRLELYDAETLPRLESAESRVVRLERELGATMEQRDDASDRLDASREAGRVMEAQRDHWRGKYRRANQEVGAAFNRGIATSSKSIPDKLWSRVCDIAFGREWTNNEALCKLVQRGLNCAGDGCGAMIDELRQQNAVLERANEQFGALVREAQAGSVMVGGDVRNMHCSGWAECTVLHCKLISMHKVGSHVNCGLSHYCVSFEEDVRCVGVTE